MSNCSFYKTMPLWSVDPGSVAVPAVELSTAGTATVFQLPAQFQCECPH